MGEETPAAKKTHKAFHKSFAKTATLEKKDRGFDRKEEAAEKRKKK